MTSDPTPTDRATSDRRRRPTRAGIVRSAATLVRERGVHGVGMREIVAHSGASRGSLGRYFPGGKTQLVTEALDLAVAELSEATGEALAGARTLREAIAVIVAPWRELLVEHDYAQGCPLAATVIDASGNDELRVHVSELIARWHASVTDIYVKFGVPHTVAANEATVLLAAIEGALVLARSRRSTEPLDTVEQHFKTIARGSQRRGRGIAPPPRSG
jgi:TetR/AcrR family transcriptional regulator, lmrAB and yxaGH operons repressor